MILYIYHDFMFFSFKMAHLEGGGGVTGFCYDFHYVFCKTYITLVFFNTNF